ncbi:MAG: glycerophosphodiester phosphodiesterase family protein [Fervidobacterium sp.]
MIILGHRGIPVLIKENTIESLLKATELSDGIETDVRLTKDGIPVLIHDDNLEHFCGVHVKVKDLTLDELKNYSFQGYTVPTLEELLSAMPKKKCLNLEIKEYEAGEITVELSRSYQGEVIYSSFNHELINELKNKYPQYKFGYLFGEEHTDMKFQDFLKLIEQNTYSVHLPIAGYKLKSKAYQELLPLVKKVGVKVVFWTVNMKEEIKPIEEYVDYVITDDVRIFKN